MSGGRLEPKWLRTAVKGPDPTPPQLDPTGVGWPLSSSHVVSHSSAVPCTTVSTPIAQASDTSISCSGPSVALHSSLNGRTGAVGRECGSLQASSARGTSTANSGWTGLMTASPPDSKPASHRTRHDRHDGLRVGQSAWRKICCEFCLTSTQTSAATSISHSNNPQKPADQQRKTSKKG